MVPWQQKKSRAAALGDKIFNIKNVGEIELQKLRNRKKRKNPISLELQEGRRGKG